MKKKTKSKRIRSGNANETWNSITGKFDGVTSLNQPDCTEQVAIDMFAPSPNSGF
jgi:hypothetical protein